MATRKYNKIIKNCLYCGEDFETFDGGQNAREFCSKSHAMKSRKLSEENKKNISNSVIKYLKENTTLSIRVEFLEINCLQCNKKFKPYFHDMKFCSKKCSEIYSIGSKRSDNTKEKMRASQLKLIEDDLHQGWKSSTRVSKEMSYPEKYVKSILDDLNISYEREFKVKRWFIDFADSNNKLALEIDGKQHELPSRKASDERKDSFLIENGWKILRIKWKKVSKEFREQLILSIEKFFNENKIKGNK